ncbi:MAG: hypothetical protein ACFBSG_07325 [Leptolyngbyaceae cyanobacterium]
MTKLVSSCVSRVLDQIGDSNPQLRRELKGRLKPFPMLMAAGISLLIQLVILIGFAAALPGPVELGDLTLNTYPQLSWSPLYQLPLEDRPDLTNLDSQALEDAETTGLFISAIGTQPPVRGSDALGQAAAQQLQIGDRLLAINGESITPLWEADNEWAYYRRVEDKILDSMAQRLTEDTLPLLNTTTQLTLYRADLGQFTVELPRIGLSNYRNNYCQLAAENSRLCLLTDNQAYYLTNWPRWHRDIFLTLSGTMTVLLMGLGAFLLVSNLVSEKQKGTLNFLRMSPRSALTILSGKLMGVPFYLYVAVALALPFHTYTALAGGIHSGELIGFDIALVSQTLIVLMGALLLGLVTTAPMLLSLMPWVAAVGALIAQWGAAASTILLWEGHNPSTAFDGAIILSPLASVAYFVDLSTFVRHPQGLNIGLGIFRLNFWEHTLLTVLSALGWCVLIGHALQRRFEYPTKALLSRRYSYLLTGTFMTIVLGLSDTQPDDYDVFPVVFVIAVAAVAYGLLLMLSLTCDRQTLQDWARFRIVRQLHEGRLPLWRDLLISDTSSPVIAVGLNFAMMAIAFAAWFWLHHRHLMDHRLAVWGFIGSILLIAGSLFFATLNSQILLLSRRPKNWFWFCSVGSISCLLFPSLTLGIAIRSFPGLMGYGRILGLSPEVAMFVIPLSLLGTVTTILAFVHWRQLILVGRSESQQLLTGDRSVRA